MDGDRRNGINANSEFGSADLASTKSSERLLHFFLTQPATSKWAGRSPHKLTLAQLRALLTVLHTGSVGSAAKHLRMTQSAVSQAIITLEKTLGLTLMSRTRFGMQPTAMAEEIIKFAKIALAATQRIEELAASAASEQNGHLRIAAVPSEAASLVPVCIRRFNALYPGVKTSVFEGNHLEVGEWVADGIADIGLTAVAPPEMEAEEIRVEELVVVGKLGHPAMRREKINRNELCEEVLITTGTGCDPLWVNLFGNDRGSPRQQIRAQGISTAIEMVREGLGVTILPEIILPSLNTLDLRVRHFDPGASRRLFGVTTGREGNHGILEAFKQVTRDAATSRRSDIQ